MLIGEIYYYISINSLHCVNMINNVE
jgi:hypothetical protein